MPIPNEIIENIRNSLNIVEVIGQYVSGLKQVGRNYRAPCPFHSEKAPSFYVSPSKNIFHCFGCKAGGDVFRFVMKIENISYFEAIEKLAGRLGIKINDTFEDKELSAEKKALFEILKSTAEFYHQYLLESKEALAASKYLIERGLKKETIDKFQLGYAHYNDILFNYLKDKFDTELLLKSGIIGISEQNKKLYDFFHGRIIFPIFDFSGRVIAFGGRTLNNNIQPSYLNSPDSLIYNKSRSLYGLFQAKDALRNSGKAVIVEGYMDVLMCHQYGVSNTVAPLGTSFTREQAHLLKRAAETIILTFDSDESGKQAAFKSAEMCIEEDLACRITNLPEKMDPDEYLLRFGKGKFEELLESGSNPVEFKSALLESKMDLKKPEDKSKFIHILLETIIKIKDSTYRQQMIKILSDKTKLDESIILVELNKFAGKEKKAYNKDSILDNLNVKIRSVEEEIISICLHFPDMANKVPAELFSDERCIHIFPFFKHFKDDKSFASILDKLDEDTGQWFTQLAVWAESQKYDIPHQKINMLIKDLKLKNQEEKRRQLEKEIIPMCEGKIPLNTSKMKEFEELTRLLKGTSIVN